MGESKRKAERYKALLEIPEEEKREIAGSVRNTILQFNDKGTLCAFVAALGLKALRDRGFDVKPVVGAMLYRAGPCTPQDVVAFCGQGNRAEIDTDGGLLGHVWLAGGPVVLDFSPHFWKEISMVRQLPQGKKLGQIEWLADPPDYIWEHADNLGRWSSYGEPDIGHVWYKPDWHLTAQKTPEVEGFLDETFLSQIAEIRRTDPQAKIIF